MEPPIAGSVYWVTEWYKHREKGRVWQEEGGGGGGVVGGLGYPLKDDTIIFCPWNCRGSYP